MTSKLFREKEVTRISKIRNRYIVDREITKNDRIFAIIYGNNWNNSHLEQTKPEFPLHLRKNGEPDADGTKMMYSKYGDVNRDPAYVDHEIVSGIRVQKLKNGKEREVFVVGVVDNVKDANAAIERYQRVVDGWNRKIARINDIKANIRKVRASVKSRYEAIEARVNSNSRRRKRSN